MDSEEAKGSLYDGLRANEVHRNSSKTKYHSTDTLELQATREI